MKKVFLLQTKRVPNETLNKHGKIKSMNTTTLDKFLLYQITFKSNWNLQKIQSSWCVFYLNTHSRWMVTNQHTVTISVDSALATRTNTSASKQCLSIHRSRSGLTSIPGLKQQLFVTIYMTVFGLLLDVEDTGRVMVEQCLINLLFSLFSCFFVFLFFLNLHILT